MFYRLQISHAECRICLICIQNRVSFGLALFDVRLNFLHTNWLICSVRALLDLQSWWSYLSLHPEICSLTAFKTHEENFRTHKFSDPVVFGTPLNITINTCLTTSDHNKPKVHFNQSKSQTHQSHYWITVRGHQSTCEYSEGVTRFSRWDGRDCAHIVVCTVKTA